MTIAGVMITRKHGLQSKSCYRLNRHPTSAHSFPCHDHQGAPSLLDSSAYGSSLTSLFFSLQCKFSLPAGVSRPAKGKDASLKFAYHAQGSSHLQYHHFYNTTTFALIHLIHSWGRFRIPPLSDSARFRKTTLV